MSSLKKGVEGRGGVLAGSHEPEELGAFEQYQTLKETLGRKVGAGWVLREGGAGCSRTMPSLKKDVNQGLLQLLESTSAIKLPRKSAQAQCTHATHRHTHTQRLTLLHCRRSGRFL
eukprot:1136471-Pelagomonas_calceolata.AAC.7